MFVVTIIPISRDMPMATLSYLSRIVSELGSFVRAPFRTGELVGVVISCIPAVNMKTEIKAMPYALRLGIEELPEYRLPMAYIEKLIEKVHETKCNPHDFLDVICSPSYEWIRGVEWSPSAVAPVAVQNTLAERLNYYAELAAASEQMVVVVVPSPAHAKSCMLQVSDSQMVTSDAQLRKFQGKEKMFTGVLFTTIAYVSCFMRKDKLLFASDSLHLTLPSPVQERVSASPSFAPTSAGTRHGVATIVFDEYLSPLYRIYVRDGVFVDRVAIWVNLLQYNNDTQVILGDRVVRFGDYACLADDHTNFRIPVPTFIESPDPKKRDKKLYEEDLIQLVTNWIKKKKPRRSIILCNQKDWYGYASCPKCGFVNSCSSCERPMRVVRVDGVHIQLQCPTCHRVEPVVDMCPSCGGYTLESKRFGVERYAELLWEAFPETYIHTLDAHTKLAKRVLSDWQQNGGILVTTSKIFSMPEFGSDMLYVTPSFWSHPDDSGPECALYQYSQLADATNTVLMPQDVWKRVYYGSSADDTSQQIKEYPTLPSYPRAQEPLLRPQRGEGSRAYPAGHTSPPAVQPKSKAQLSVLSSQFLDPLLDWQQQARAEIAASKQHNVPLPCTLW